MRKTMKSYFVFTSPLYRLVMFLLLPAAGAGISVWAYSASGHIGGVLIAAALVLPVVETVSDSWVFAGIQTSGLSKLDYLKTSGKGRDVMRRALIADMVRKLVSSAGILGLCYVCIGLCAVLCGDRTEGAAAAVSGAFRIRGAETGTGAVLWCLIMLTFFFSVLGTFLSRFGNLIWINIAVGYYLNAGLEVASLFLPGFFLYPYVYGAVFGLLGLCVGWLAVRTALGRMERSCYDEAPSRGGRHGLTDDGTGR